MQSVRQEKAIRLLKLMLLNEEEFLNMNFLKNIKEKQSGELVLFLIFAILFVAMSILSPTQFLSAANIQNIMRQMPEFGLIPVQQLLQRCSCNLPSESVIRC